MNLCEPILLPLTNTHGKKYLKGIPFLTEMCYNYKNVISFALFVYFFFARERFVV